MLDPSFGLRAPGLGSISDQRCACAPSSLNPISEPSIIPFSSSHLAPSPSSLTSRPSNTRGTSNPITSVSRRPSIHFLPLLPIAGSARQFYIAFTSTTLHCCLPSLRVLPCTSTTSILSYDLALSNIHLRHITAGSVISNLLRLAPGYACRLGS